MSSMAADKDEEVRRKERVELAEDLLRNVPVAAQPAKAKSRWIAANLTKPDPRSVY
jgi:hypothetical protein